MRRNSAKLSGRHRAWLYSSTLSLYVTGTVWAWLHHVNRGVADDFPSASPTEPWMMKLHGAAAMAILIILGTLLPGHVRYAWHARRNRPNGIALLAVFAFLIASGYGLYYSGDERLRWWTSWSHLAIGLVLPAVIILHIWRGQRSSVRKLPPV
jgi:cation transport ATPase